MNSSFSESLKQQVGQLVMVGFDGFVPNAQIEGLIREQRIGGVILFRRNIESPAQVAALCRGLQAINAEVSDIPLLIAIDQEGGMVMRIEAGVTPLPSAMVPMIWPCCRKPAWAWRCMPSRTCSKARSSASTMAT